MWRSSPIAVVLAAVMLLTANGVAEAYTGPALIVSYSANGVTGGVTLAPELGIDDDPSTAARVGYRGGVIEYAYADGMPRRVQGLSVSGATKTGGWVYLIDGAGNTVYTINASDLANDKSVAFPEALVLRYLFITEGGDFWYIHDIKPHLVTVPPPGAPQALRLQAVSSAGVHLAWSVPVDGGPVALYRVYRGGVVIAEVTGLTYVDAAVTPGEIYSYTVSAVNDGGESPPASPIEAVIPEPPVAPGPPQTVSAGAVTSAGVPITWQVPSSGGEAVGYRVYRDGVLIAEVTGLTHMDATVTLGTTYAYSVSAYNESGESAPSDPIVVTIPEMPDPPHPPARIRASAGVRQVSLRWDAPAGGGPAETYRVYRDGLLLGATEGGMWIDRDLAPDQTYTYAVSAVNRAGESERAELAVRTAPPGVIDGVTSNLADLGKWVTQALGILLPFFLVAAALIIARRLLGTGLTWFRPQRRVR